MQRFLALLFAAAITFTAFRATADDAPPAAAPLADPTILLLQDDTARTDLALIPDQRTALDALLLKHNAMLIAIRDVGLAAASDEPSAKSVIAEIRSGVSQLLTEPQRLRLQGLVMQAQGYDHLARTDIATELKLTYAQQHKLAKLNADFHTRSKALNADIGKRSPQELQADLNKLQAARQKQIVATLDQPQLKRWAELLGAPFDFSKVATGPGLAPEFPADEFANTARWLNSPPLTLESLRGQVVVIHFFAFNCYNCKNNYPWYREWQADLAGKGVTLVGIHTPETAAEENVASLQASLDEHGLKFPVAVDAQKTMWTAWRNNIWPAVYIIDKRGRLRYWWYGELDWQGAGNQKNARRQIEELLAEPAP